MKLITKDENGFPLNFDPSTFYTEEEKYIYLDPNLYNTEPYNYSVSTWGRLFNLYTGKPHPRELIRSRNIYIHTSILDRDGKEVHIVMHQLMARIFIPIPDHLKNVKIIMPNHKDGVKWHNEPYNLEYVDNSGNIRHADANNLISRPYGEDNGYSKLTDAQYDQICRLTQDGYLPYQINKIMNIGIDITNICQKIRSGKSEIIISNNYDFSNIPRNDYKKFTEDEVRTICLCLQNYPGMNSYDILKYIGYDIYNMDKVKLKKYRDTISTIKRRVSYREIGKDYLF